MRILNQILVEAPQFDMWKQSICLMYRGSIAHGTYIPNNKPTSVDDKDVIGVAIPTKEYFYGLKDFEQFERKHEYWDVLIYDFRKFVRLLIKSNPNVLGVLWTPEKHIIKSTDHYKRLMENREMFLSKDVYKSFCGYAYAQLHKMENAAFNGYMGEKREQLVKEFGYDCKNAQHLIRLLRQGIECLNTGELIVERPDACELIQIKNGLWSLDKVKREATKLFKDMDVAFKNTKLPPKTDPVSIDNLVCEILSEHFNG